MEKSIQNVILTNLIHNESFTRRVIPFLKKKYFEGNQKYIFDLIINFVTRYNKLPGLEALEIELNTFVVDMNLTEGQYEELVKNISSMKEYEESDHQWLMDQTEKWVQDRSLYLAIMESINIIDGKNTDLSRTAIPTILSDALSVSFDTNIGHDYEHDVEARYEFYHEDLERIPFDLDIFNKITKGGVPNKTLNIFMSDTGVGKSLTMCHMAASNITHGKNVLYLTMEMSEERIAERIDANILDITMDQLYELPKDLFVTKVGRLLRGASAGQLIIKEYPTGAPHVGHFRALLNDLKLKKNFVPDIIYIDYINICSSARLKFGGGINTYSFIKAIGEELRGLAIEFDLPIISATQSNRCLVPETIVTEKTRGKVQLGTIKEGDEILSVGDDHEDIWVIVKKVFPQTSKIVYEITTHYGKKIKCSSNHLFPTESGLNSIDGGLMIGDIFLSRGKNTFYFDSIVSIEEIGERETIDIECSGNRLFFANDILTHNSGHNNSDVDLTNVSESYGLTNVADFFAALIATEDLEKQGQIMVRQLKNRYNSLDYYRRFLIGVDKSKMKLYDLEEAAQKGLSDAGNQGMPTPGTTSMPGNSKKKKQHDFSGMKV